MEDQSKYSTRANYQGKTEIFRIYYNPREISFDLFLWIEYKTVFKAIIDGFKTFKAFPTKDLGSIMVCKN